MIFQLIQQKSTPLGTSLSSPSNGSSGAVVALMPKIGGTNMDDLGPSDLKTILHSKRANLYYLEHCRVLVNGGRVEYVTDAGKAPLYWNILTANTTSILLGTGISITQTAMRELVKAGIPVGFCDGGGTPLFASSEVEVSWLVPQASTDPPTICNVGLVSGLTRTNA